MIQPISGPARQPAAVEGVRAASGAQRPEPEGQDRPQKPDMDEYIPEERWGSGGKAESCTGNTDKVDREIERLKQKREELKQQLQSETDESRIKGLEQKLAQVERELAQKDNDAYRRQHTVFSFREE